MFNQKQKLIILCFCDRAPFTALLLYIPKVFENASSKIFWNIFFASMQFFGNTTVKRLRDIPTFRKTRKISRNKKIAHFVMPLGCSKTFADDTSIKSFRDTLFINTKNSENPIPIIKLLSFPNFA